MSTLREREQLRLSVLTWLYEVSGANRMIGVYCRGFLEVPENSGVDGAELNAAIWYIADEGLAGVDLVSDGGSIPVQAHISHDGIMLVESNIRQLERKREQEQRERMSST